MPSAFHAEAKAAGERACGARCLVCDLMRRSSSVKIVTINGRMDFPKATKLRGVAAVYYTDRSDMSGAACGADGGR
jgi:hypothetical protein